MGNLLATKGAQPSKPVRYGILWSNRLSYDGIWTNRSPLRDAASGHIEEEFYGSRGDALVDGLNCETSSKLTLIRRPGHTVYNSKTFPPIDRYYENRTSTFNQSQTSSTENIQVIADSTAASQVLSISTLKLVYNSGLGFQEAILMYGGTYIIPVGTSVSFAGMTVNTSLNGLSFTVLSSTPGSAVFNVGSSHVNSGPTPDTGTMTLSDGGIIYDATGPDTQDVLYTKSAGAGFTSFQSVGNALYFSDGPDQKKLLTPSLVWAPNTIFNQGAYILDSNGFLQVAESAFTLNITNILVSSINGVFYALITFNETVPWTVGTSLTFNGMTAFTGLNGTTLAIQSPTVYGANADQVAVLAPATTPFGPSGETGTATSQNTATQNQSGATLPAFNPALGGVTNDGNVQWRNFGVPLYNWGLATPTVAPTISQNPNYRTWRPNTPYALYYSILDTNNNVQFVSTAGQSGSSVPAWNGQIPAVTYTTISTTVGSTTTTTTIGTPTAGGPTSDNTITWTNAGPIVSWSPSTVFGFNKAILDSNGNLQIMISATSPSTSGATTPAWSVTVGGTTTDGNITWMNVGTGNIVFTGSVQYAYSYHSVDKSVSTASPTVSQNFNTQVFGPPGQFRAQLFGPTIADPQIDQIWVWRTTQGGGVFLFLDAVPNPSVGTASTWSYTDFLPDTSLDPLIEAPLADENNPPPVGITGLTFHLGCIFGYVGNQVFFSNGPGDPVGNGSTAWNPANVFTFPSSAVRLFPTVSGLTVFTTSDVYVIQGTNTSSSPLFASPFLQNIGLSSYDAFAVNGSIIYMYTSDNQFITLDPSSGVSQIGFPIGDQFGPTQGTETFTPLTTRVTWHVDGSREQAIYVSDYVGSWWRMLPTPSPETGNTWCPRASIAGGFSAVQSVETTPGNRDLLVGPAVSGPILKRDFSVNSDNGVAYQAYAVIGSIVFAQPGQLAMIESITTDSQAVGTPPTLAVQLDEITYITGLATAVPNAPGTGYAVGNLVQIAVVGAQPAVARVLTIGAGGAVDTLQITVSGQTFPDNGTAVPTTNITGTGTGLTVNTTLGGYFEPLVFYHPDPTQLEPSATTYAQRFYLSETQLPAVCRHMQIEVNWGMDTVQNELLSLSVFGGWDQEK